MRRGAVAAVVPLLWALGVLGVLGTLGSAAVPDITEPSFIEACLREHNQARRSVQPPASVTMKPLSWDHGLARVAKAWAQRCLFEHNPEPDKEILAHSNVSVGENIWMGTPASAFSVQRAVESWVKERAHYDYQSNTCSHVCGHYTQVVWAASDKLGCSAQLCPDGVKKSGYDDKEGVIFVCNYAPAGNIVQMWPYVSKVSPSSDSKAFSLASTQDVTVTPSDVNYTVILIVRPFALLATFLAAYGVRHFYPNVFCYE